jgi:hypothetical protein
MRAGRQPTAEWSEIETGVVKLDAALRALRSSGHLSELEHRRCRRAVRRVMLLRSAARSVEHREAA